MEKLSECKKTAKEFGISVLTGTAVLFILFGIATSLHYSLVLFFVGLGLGSIIYLIWRLI